MRIKLATLVLIASCLPAMAVPLSQGNSALISGRAHVQRAAEGTYLNIENRGGSIAGFIPFGDQSTFPDLDYLDGRRVAMSGVVVWDGRAMIVLNDRKQLDVAG